MVNETFGGQGGTVYLSKSHIKNMKRNMRKVPIIQIRSDLYHNKETNEAEIIISKIDDISLVENVNNKQLQEIKHDNKNWIKRLLEKIKNLFRNNI